MSSPIPEGSYGTTRERAASVSYAEIEAVARRLMAGGSYASVGAVRKELKRGSSTTIAEAMRRFWKNQAALDAGNPIALTRLPPELADAALDLWEQALRLSQQTVQSDDNAARAQIEQLRRDTDFRVRSMELREKEWDMAARVRERALSDAREQLTVLVNELAASRAELRSLERRNADLAGQVEQFRAQLATVIAKAVARHRPQRVVVPKAPRPGSGRSRRKAQRATNSPAKRASVQKHRRGSKDAEKKGRKRLARR